MQRPEGNESVFLFFSVWRWYGHGRVEFFQAVEAVVFAVTAEVVGDVGAFEPAGGRRGVQRVPDMIGRCVAVDRADADADAAQAMAQIVILAAPASKIFVVAIHASKSAPEIPMFPPNMSGLRRWRTKLCHQETR